MSLTIISYQIPVMGSFSSSSTFRDKTYHPRSLVVVLEVGIVAFEDEAVVVVFDDLHFFSILHLVREAALQADEVLLEEDLKDLRNGAKDWMIVGHMAGIFVGTNYFLYNDPLRWKNELPT